MGNSSLAQRVMPIIGAFYVLIGIVGFFVTGFGNFIQNTDDALLGFSLNPFHNVVHLAIGAFLIIMSRQSTATAEGACLGVGLFYVSAMIIGVIGESNLTIISMFGRGDLENVNHAVNGLLLLGLGLVSTGATEAQSRRTGIPA